MIRRQGFAVDAGTETKHWNNDSQRVGCCGHVNQTQRNRQVELLIPIFMQFLVGWLAQCNRPPEQAKEALEHNFDVGSDGVTRVWDSDFIQAGRIRAKRAVRRLHRQDRSQPKRRSTVELDAMVTEEFNRIMDTPDNEVVAACGATAPLFDE